MHKESKQESLFNTVPRPDLTKNPLFIIKDGKRTKLTISQIFDTNKYDHFSGVTFSTSARFINKYIAKFKNSNLIVGITGDGEEAYNGFSAVSTNHLKDLHRNLNHEITDLYQDINTEAKIQLYHRTFKLSVPCTTVIHSKFYLLSNSETNETRLILGSANLSENAFNPHIKQFEDIIIFDNDSALYSVYMDYFKNELLSTTKSFFPKALIHDFTERELKAKKNQGKSKNAIIIQLSPDQVKSMNVNQYINSANTIQHKNNNEEISDDDLSKMKSTKSKTHQINQRNKKQGQIQKVALQMQSKIVNPRTKRPKTKTPQSLKNVYHKYVQVTQTKNVKGSITKRQANIVSQPDQRNQYNTGLFINRGKNKDLIPLGQTSDVEILRNNLNGIQHLMDSYNRFAIKSNNKYCSRLMEAIIYAFTSPFLYEIRQKVSNKIEGQKLPQFLFIGGVGNSGKSHLLRIIMRLLGIYKTTKPQLYDSIIERTAKNKKKATIDQISSWINSENVAPLILDEVPKVFFSNPRYGDNLVVNETNEHSDGELSGNAFPTLIGTTNTNAYVFPTRARRRSYYLINDKPFNDTYQQQSTESYNRIFKNLDSKLFLDFIVRFSKLLYEKPDSYWVHYDKNGKFDFLYRARQIFANYYHECGLPLPKFFPHEISSDSKESGRTKWRKLYEASPQLFITNKNSPNSFFISINKLNQNANKYGRKPSQDYRDSLSPEITVGSKDGLQIELDKELFFKWINITPPHQPVWKRLFSIK